MNQGILNESKVLKGLFGDDLFIKAQTDQTNMLESLRRNNQLRVNRNSGIIGSAAVAVTSVIKPNTFFGA